MNVILGKDTETDIENVYMVHLTNFFPKNHRILSTYDGNKISSKDKDGNEIVVSFNGNKKSVVVPSHRHTVHFTLNTVVEPTKDGAGDWSDCPIAVIEPFKNHQNQFLTYGSGDSYTWGSVDLSDEAVIIINKNNISLIPNEEREKWNIITTDEVDLSIAIKKFFREKNIPLVDYYDHAGHSFSLEYKLEKNLLCRDSAINYVKSNQYTGKGKISFSIDELAQILNIQHDKDNSPGKIQPNLGGLFRPLLPENACAPRNFYELMLVNGFYYNEQNELSLRSDEDIYSALQPLEVLLDMGEDDVKKQEIYASKLYTNYMQNIEKIYAEYMEYINTRNHEDLTDFEMQIIENEKKEALRLLKEKPKEITEFQEKMIQRYNKMLLNSKSEDLSEEEQAYIKSLFPNLSIDSKEGKYNIIFDKANHRFRITTDNDTYNENTDIDAANQLNNKMAQHSMIRFNPLFDEYLLNVMPQSKEETYNEYYSRLSSYFNGLQAIMQGKKVEISENGILVEETKNKGNNIPDNPLLQSAIEATMESTNKTAIDTQLTQIVAEVKQPNKEVQQEVK